MDAVWCLLLLYIALVYKWECGWEAPMGQTVAPVSVTCKETKSLPAKRVGKTEAGGAIRSSGDPNCLAHGRSRAVCILHSLTFSNVIWEEAMLAVRREEGTVVRMSESILRSAGCNRRRAEP